MCEYDFDYYVDDIGTIEWSPEFGRCDCGYQPTPGEPVSAFVEIADDDVGPLCTACDSEGFILVVDNYGDELDVECRPCDGRGTVPRPDDDLARGVFCPQCDAARQLLAKWCEGHYAYGDIPRQIVDHWHEDTAYRSWPFARLVAHARRHWRSPSGAPVPADDLARLVGRSIEAAA